MKNKVTNNESSDNFFKSNIIPIITIFALGFLTYAIKLFTYSFSIDTEDLLVNTDYLFTSWLSISRYGLIFLKKIFDVAKFNLILANWVGFLLMFFAVLFTIYNINKITKKNNIIANILFGGIVITSPIIVEQFNFTLQCVEVSLALFLINIAFLILNNCVINKNKYYLLIIPVLIMTLAFACYQSFVPLMITMSTFFIILIYKEKDDKKFSVILMYAVIFILSFVLYKIIDKVVLAATGVQPTPYLNGQIMWGKIRNIEVIKNIIGTMYIVLTGSGSIYYNIGLLVCIIGFAVIVIKDFNLKNWLYYVAIIGFCISPFLLILITGNQPAARTAFPIVYATALGIYYICCCVDKDFLRGVIVGIFALIILNQMNTSIGLFYTDYNVFKQEKQLAESIASDIEQRGLNDKPLAFVGAYSAQSRGINVKGEVMGHTFFEWDYGTEIDSNRRIQGFLKVLGYNFEYMKNEDYPEIKEKAMKMESSYPEEGYIQEEEDYVIIKLNK